MSPEASSLESFGKGSWSDIAGSLGHGTDTELLVKAEGGSGCVERGSEFGYVSKLFNIR